MSYMPIDETPLSNPPTSLLLRLVSEIQAQTRAQTAVIVLAEQDGTVGHYAEAVGQHAGWLRGRRGPSATSGLSGTAFRSASPVLVPDTLGDDRVRQDHAEQLGIKTALAAALRYEGRLLGALMLLNKNDGSAFDTQDEALLSRYIETIAADLAVYLAGAPLHGPEAEAKEG